MSTDMDEKANQSMQNSVPPQPQESQSPNSQHVKQYYQLQQDLMFHQSYNEFQQVIPNLYIGGQVSSMNLQKLKQLNITRVLKVNGIQNTFPFAKYGVEIKVMDIDDMPDFDITPYFQEANQFIHEVISQNQGCLVVCTAGISRSASIVISYLMTHNKMTYDQAYEITKKARIFIKPNPGFERNLKSYETKLRCELCNLTRKTPWLDQYTNFQNQSFLGKTQAKRFQVLICDQCDGPMIVFVESHKQELSPSDLILAQAICEQVGNDFYGTNQWFIEGKQRTIGDHFHWHIRSVNESYLNTGDMGVLKCKNVQQIQALNTKIQKELPIIQSENPLTLSQVKSELHSQLNSLLTQNFPILKSEKQIQVLEQTTQQLQKLDSSYESQQFKVKSHFRLQIQNKFMIEQQIIQIGNKKVIGKRYTRGEILQKDQANDKIELIGKL
eukprot:403348987